MPTKKEFLAKVDKPSEDALRLHALYHGKIQTLPKCSIRDFSDFAIWYTPGVAAPCKAIQAQPKLIFEYTNKANCIAIVSDGTRVLGLGDIGPEAALPVMEGKALLFKYLGGVDAVPLCLRTKDPEELIRTVKLLEPSFGGINLEDIAQPKCFGILDRLRKEVTIPVWHDDQQGSGTVILAALMNALNIVGKDLRRLKIAMVGMGAANVATYRLLKACGVDAGGIVACDSKGILHRRRHDIEARQAEFADKWRVCCETNVEGLEGGTAAALRGADVCIAFSRSGPDVIDPTWVKAMARDAVVFACANPIPEIWPWDAKEAGARIVCTGRSDFPNQVNNSLVFPGVFRGALDVRAQTITDEMAMAAAHELAHWAEKRGIHDDDIVPRMDEWEVVPRVAVATALKAQTQGIARVIKTEAQLYEDAAARIRAARDATHMLMKEGYIPPPTLFTYQPKESGLRLDTHERQAVEEFLQELARERFDPQPIVDHDRLSRGAEGQIIVPVLLDAEEPRLSLALLMAHKAEHLYKHTNCRMVLAQRPRRDPTGSTYVWKDEAWHTFPD